MTGQFFLFVFADSQAEWNTSQWRSLTISDGLNASGKHKARCIPINDFAQYGHDTVQAVVGPADVIVVQRNLLHPEIWKACDYWRGLGKLVVADLDDDYPHLTPQNPAYPFWILDKAGLKESLGYTPIEALTEGFKHVDALISPNELIIKDWQEVLPGFKGYWVPNYAHWPWYKELQQKPFNAETQRRGDAEAFIEEQIVIGWGGSVSHWDSWWFSGLREVVPEITAQYPRVMWKVCGGDQRIKQFFERLVPGRWIDQAGVPPEHWPAQVASFDIGLAPLCGPEYPQGERYDLRRSWLKAVEYLLTGVPWLGSEGIVYAKLDGKGGRTVENSPEAWYEALCDTVDNLAERKMESKRLMAWARDNLAMEHVVDQYVQIFNDIAAERNAAQGMRLPNVWYAGDIFGQTEELAGRVEVSVSGDDVDALAMVQAQTFRISKEWHEGIPLEYSAGSGSGQGRDAGPDPGRGLSLATILQYPLLTQVNTIAWESTSGS